MAEASLKKWRPPRWLVAVAAVVAVYTLFGFLILPRIVKAQLEKRLPALLHRPVKVRQVLFNPYAMSITVRGFSVEKLLSFEELYVDLALWKHLGGGVHVAEIKLVEPQLDVAVEKGGKLSFADLLEPSGEKAAPSGKPLLVEISRFELERGAVEFADRNRPQPFQARLAPLTFALDGFSTAPQKNGAYQFKARLEPATTLEWNGAISITPLKSAGTLEIKGVQLPQFATYSQESTQLRITEGVLDVSARYTFDASREPTVIRLDDGSVHLAGLRVDPPGRRDALVAIESLALDGLSADVGTQQARLKSVSLSGARIVARRAKDGRIELAELAKPRVPAPPSEKSPWTARLDELRLDRVSLVWEDAVPRTPARLTVDDLQVRAGPYVFPGDEATAFTTSMRINDGGRFAAKGTAHAGSASADVELGLEKLALAPFNPYAGDFITGSLGRGTLDVKGRASYSAAKTRFAGDVAVDGLALLDAGGKELAGFDRFALEQLDTDTVTTAIRRVLLRGARVHYRIEGPEADNWSTLMRPRPAGAQPEPAKKPVSASKTSIQLIAIEGMSLDVVDRSVQPPFSTKLTQFGGRIAPFTQPGLAKSKIDLAGKLDGARVLVAGAVRPAGKDSDADVVVSLSPWDLPPTTPYGIRFAGYPVEKGKLALDLKYKVGSRKIQASNLVTINQLTLGKSVESPTATKLPVKLALAILTDRSGKLEIDLPVEGSLDDPDFRIGKLVVHAILNVLEKAATAPFALLGGLFGSSEDLSAVDFASGAEDLAEAEQAKLAKLAKALVERPALRLSITGLADEATDREGLLKVRLEDALRTGDEEELTDAQRLSRLRALFETRIAAPREQQAAALRAAGKPVPPDLVPRRDLSAAELEAQLMPTVTLSTEDYAELARARAETVQDALSEVEGLDPGRVFLSTEQREAKGKRQALLQLE